MNKEKERIENYDVLVVGGGVSGVCASVCAARNNFRVLLIEKNDYIGGVAVGCMHKAVCGLYKNEQDETSDIENTLNKGITQELVRFLKEKYKILQINRIGKVNVLPLPDDSLELFLNELIKNEKKLNSLLNTEICEVELRDNRIALLRARRPGENINIIPKIVIDCSGGSVVSRLAEIPVLKVDESKEQLCGYTAKIVMISQVDESLMIKIPYLAREFVSSVGAPDFIKYTTFIKGDTKEEGYLKMNIPYSERERREEYLRKLFRFITENLDEMKNAQIEKTSEDIFARDGLGIEGEYFLTEEDVLAAKKFDDGLLKGAWPIEQWLSGKGTCYKYVKENDYYEIPERCLKSKIASNLLASGKCISASPDALGSTRVIGICMSLGEAAGRLASRMINR